MLLLLIIIIRHTLDINGNWHYTVHTRIFLLCSTVSVIQLIFVGFEIFRHVRCNFTRKKDKNEKCDDDDDDEYVFVYN